jgi:serine/threonine-protein kinase RsbW
VDDAVVRLSVPATPAGVREAILAFEHFGRSRRVSSGTGWRVQLALDEILSNIVRHGTPSSPAIEMTFSFNAGTISVEIVDATGPFNPLRAPAPDTVSPLEAREPGGLGLSLVRRLMDETLYERRDDRNHFVMRCGPHADS